MFLYFVPSNSATVPDFLRYALEDGCTISRVQTLAGPSGLGNGTLFVRGEATPRITASQTWTVAANNAYAVGVEQGTKLSPDLLAREEPLPGHWVTLGDGSRWLCAIARGFNTEQARFYSPLPRSLQFDPPSNSWIPGKVVRQYRRFLELAMQYAEASTRAIAEERAHFEFPAVDELALLGLTANYRISALELSLFDDAYTIETRRQLINAILDVPTLNAWAEKKREQELAGSNT